MSRKHFWGFKNRRQQHKYMVDLEQCLKYNWRHMRHDTVHNKQCWRKAEYLHDKGWIHKARANGWVK